MQNRMVFIVFYDLPVTTPEERRKANAFHKLLVKSGYQRLQRSVYVRLFRNRLHIAAELRKIGNEAPKDGNVAIIPLSLDDFKRMVSVTREKFDMKMFSDDVICI